MGTHMLEAIKLRSRSCYSGKEGMTDGETEGQGSVVDVLSAVAGGLVWSGGSCLRVCCCHAVRPPITGRHVLTS